MFYPPNLIDRELDKVFAKIKEKNMLKETDKEKAFDNLKFEKVELADKTIYYPKFISRDSGAREIYRNEIRKGRSYKDDIFVLDILREEMKNDDSRIQRILSI